jgi:hypothetical protein
VLNDGSDRVRKRPTNASEESHPTELSKARQSGRAKNRTRLSDVDRRKQKAIAAFERPPRIFLNWGHVDEVRAFVGRQVDLYTDIEIPAGRNVVFERLTRTFNDQQFGRRVVNLEAKSIAGACGPGLSGLVRDRSANPHHAAPPTYRAAG